jgi:hypothetical protein
MRFSFLPLQQGSVITEIEDANNPTGIGHVANGHLHLVNDAERFHVGPPFASTLRRETAFDDCCCHLSPPRVPIIFFSRR